jgi:hypothetical protein
MSPSSTARALAYLSSGLLVSMMLLTLTTGVAQEPFEVVRPLAGSDRRDPRVRDLVRRGVIVGFWRSGSAEA